MLEGSVARALETHAQVPGWKRPGNPTVANLPRTKRRLRPPAWGPPPGAPVQPPRCVRGLNGRATTCQSASFPAGPKRPRHTPCNRNTLNNAGCVSPASSPESWATAFSRLAPTRQLAAPQDLRARAGTPGGAPEAVTPRGPGTFGTRRDTGISVVLRLPAMVALGQGPKSTVAKLRKGCPTSCGLRRLPGA